MSHDCKQVEATLIALGQFLPKDNEVTDDYYDIDFNHCTVCGKEFESEE